MDIPVCGNCGSPEIITMRDVGSDIDPSGEESQHLNVCKKCGAQQLWAERWEDFITLKVHHGEWHKKEDCPPLWY